MGYQDRYIYTIETMCKIGLPRWIVVQNPPAVQETHRRYGFNPWVGKIPLEEEMATHSSILAWRIPWTEKPGGLQSMGHRVGHN